MAKKNSSSPTPPQPIKAPEPVPQIDQKQVVSGIGQSVNSLSNSVGNQNLMGTQLGMSTLAQYLDTDGRSLTLDPAVAEGAQKSIKTTTSKLTKGEGALKKQSGKLKGLEGKLALAPAGTKAHNNLQKQIDKLKPKVTELQTTVDGYKTTIAGAQKTLKDGGSSISDLYKKADPETYAAIDRAKGYAAQIGQITPQGQKFLDAAGAGYQSRNIAQNNISAAQVGNMADVSARDIQAARIAEVQNIRARQIAAEQAGMSGLGSQLMNTAGQRLALGGMLSTEASRDAVQSARVGMAARGMATGNSALAAELLNRDRYSQQRFQQDAAFAQGVEQQDLSRRLANVSEANRIAQANQQANLAAQQANQQAAYNRSVEKARLAQQAALANQESALRAATQNQNAALTLGQTNASLAQQAALANQDNAFRVSALNESNRLSGVQQNLSQLGAASNYVDATNRAGMAANVDMAGVSASYNPLFRNLGMSQQNIFGTNNLGSLTLGPAAQIGLGVANINNATSQFNNSTQGNYDSFNANMAASNYNSYMNNQAALRGAGVVGGSTNRAGNAVMGAGVGLAGGAIAGAAMGSVVPGIGTLAGAAIGGAMGAAGGGGVGYFCWIARAAWGEDNPRWIEFRDSMLTHAPEWFVAAYMQHGESIARHIHTPARRVVARVILSTLQRLWTPAKSTLQPA